MLEIPTLRRVVHDEQRLGGRFPEDAERIHQQRTYTSPIWYNPQLSVEGADN